MPRLEIDPPSPRHEHEHNLWTQTEVFRFYAEQRRANCNYKQVMDLWLRVPYCDGCIQSQWWYHGEPPDIVAESWSEQLADYVGQGQVEEWMSAFDNREEIEGISCVECNRGIRPWESEDIYVDHRHVEEHYAIPLETGNVTPSKRVRDCILKLYGKVCFNCHSPTRNIDHIIPRAKGGTAAFRNLQPLCERCGNEKRDS